jgi:MerR family transcriptional regulator, redox-sensitive transcriptional activator SoxR
MKGFFINMAELTIGELAEQSGLQTSALRYYESVGLLSPARRVGGQRRYDPVVLQRLAFIKLSQQAGFSVKEIRTLLEGFKMDTPPSARWRIMAGKKLVEVEDLMLKVQRMKYLLEEGLKCGCLSFEECLPYLTTELKCDKPNCLDSKQN